MAPHDPHRLLMSLTPSFIRRRLLRYARKTLMQELQTNEAKMNKVQLEPRHMENLRCLPTRTDLLERFPKGGKIVEVGVDNGDFSADILRVTQPSELHLVDSWGSERYHKGKQQAVQDRFAKQTAEGIVQVHVGLSTERAADFKDGSLDVVYIDTDHSYETTRAELSLFGPKVRPGGFLAGHDYIMGNWAGLYRYGGIEAVHEYCHAEDWELVHLTMEQGTSPSFALRRIG